MEGGDFIERRAYFNFLLRAAGLTIETRIKEPIFIRTLRLKFNIFNPLNNNLSEAGTGGGSYITGFMSSEFLKAFKKFFTFC